MRLIHRIGMATWWVWSWHYAWKDYKRPIEWQAYPWPKLSKA